MERSEMAAVLTSDSEALRRTLKGEAAKRERIEEEARRRGCVVLPVDKADLERKLREGVAAGVFTTETVDEILSQIRTISVDEGFPDEG